MTRQSMGWRTLIAFGGLAVTASGWAKSPAKSTRVKPPVSLSVEANEWNERGIAAFKQKKYDEAIQAYWRALDLDPTFEKAYNNMANAFLAKGDVKTALRHYQTAVNMNPRYAEAYANMGIAYYQIENFQQSVDAYKKAVGINPAYADAFCNMAVAYQHLDLVDEAVSALQAALKAKPDHPIALLNLGAIYHALDRTVEAQKILDQLNKVDGALAEELKLLMNPPVHPGETLDAHGDHK